MSSAAALPPSTTDIIQVRSWWSDFHSSTFTISFLSGLAIGVIIAGNVAAPGSSLFYSCIGTGGAAGGLAGPLVEKCIAAVKYPARQYRQAPINDQSFTNESEAVIDDIVATEFEKTSWYQRWGRDKEVLPKLCERGVCYGVLATLVRLMPKHHHLSSVELHALLHTPENRRSVLKHQCFEFILADLDNRANRDLSHLPAIVEAKEDVGYLERTAILLNLFNEETFITSLPKLSNAYGIITFGKKNWGHGFFVQFDDHFRFCDTYNAETGLYEFPTQELLLHYLYKQLWSYEPINDVALYLYSFEPIDK